MWLQKKFTDLVVGRTEELLDWDGKTWETHGFLEVFPEFSSNKNVRLSWIWLHKIVSRKACFWLSENGAVPSPFSEARIYGIVRWTDRIYIFSNQGFWGRLFWGKWSEVIIINQNMVGGLTYVQHFSTIEIDGNGMLLGCWYPILDFPKKNLSYFSRWSLATKQLGFPISKNPRWDPIFTSGFKTQNFRWIRGLWREMSTLPGCNCNGSITFFGWSNPIFLAASLFNTSWLESQFVFLRFPIFMLRLSWSKTLFNHNISSIFYGLKHLYIYIETTTYNFLIFL
jgi:hypothetical protein